MEFEAPWWGVFDNAIDMAHSECWCSRNRLIIAL